jgi:hypothetical protein
VSAELQLNIEERNNIMAIRKKSSAILLIGLFFLVLALITIAIKKREIAIDVVSPSFILIVYS